MQRDNYPKPLPERTERLPAQEKVAASDELAPALLAEQVYAQYFATAKGFEIIRPQGFIP